MSDTDTTTRSCITPRARLAFPALFEARSFNDQAAKFSAVLVFDKEAQASPEFAALKKAAHAAAVDKFGAKLPNKLRSPFRPGSDRVGVSGFNEDDVFISVTSKRQPKVVDRKKVNGKFPIIDDPEKVYPGCYVRASVNAFGYDNQGNKGVSFGLNNVQFLEDGERTGGGGQNPDAEFGEVEGDNISSGDSGDDIF